MVYLPDLHYCCVCNVYLGMNDGDAICSECECLDEVNELEIRLNGFSSLQKGWDSYDAEAPSEEVIGQAMTFLKFLIKKNKLPDNLNPAVVGGEHKIE